MNKYRCQTMTTKVNDSPKIDARRCSPDTVWCRGWSKPTSLRPSCLISSVTATTDSQTDRT